MPTDRKKTAFVARFIGAVALASSLIAAACSDSPSSLGEPGGGGGGQADGGSKRNPPSRAAWAIPTSCGAFIADAVSSLAIADPGGVCDDGTACGGHGPTTVVSGAEECAHCCIPKTCAALLGAAGLGNIACETGGNGACGGRAGIPTSDCDICCGDAASGGAVFQLPYQAGQSYTVGPKGYHDRIYPNILGYDFITTMGAPLVSPMSGTVKTCASAGCIDGVGNPYIEIVRTLDDGRVLSIVMMHGNYQVTPDGAVTRGQSSLGTEASNGNSTAPHTHFSVRVDGVAVEFLNPAQATKISDAPPTYRLNL